MPNWKHTLAIKNIFMEYYGTPSSEETTEMATQVCDKIKELVKRLTEREPSNELIYELESVIEEFENIDPSDADDDAQNQFNFALDQLYSVGDFNHRIWIK